MHYEYLAWNISDSNNLSAYPANSGKVANSICFDGANSYGFFVLPDSRLFTVEYINIGLAPTAIVSGDIFFVGINEMFSGYDLISGVRKFSYEMPSIFHEFVLVGDPLVIRDEIGFVGISMNGEKVWEFLESGPIGRFYLTEGCIKGVTIDGRSFSFKIPEPLPMQVQINQ